MIFETSLNNLYEIDLSFINEDPYTSELYACIYIENCLLI